MPMSIDDPMSISNSVRIAMKAAGLRIRRLAELFGVSAGVMSQKLSHSYWTGSDLARIAEITGGKLEFVYPSGFSIPINIDKPVHRREYKNVRDAKTSMKKRDMESADNNSRQSVEPLNSAIDEGRIQNMPCMDESPSRLEEERNFLPVQKGSVNGSSEEESPVPPDKEAALNHPSEQDDPVATEGKEYDPGEDTPDDTALTQQDDDIPGEDFTSSPVTDGAAESTNTEDSYYSGDYRPAEYQIYKTPADSGSVGKDMYIVKSFKKNIINRAEQIINIEAPIHKDLLMERILGSFGVHNTTEAISATNTALNSRDRFNHKNIKKDVFFWKENTDPDKYKVFRVGEKDLEKVCLYDLKNAICYTLKHHTERTGSIMMDVNDLLKEVSRLFNIHRLTDNPRAVLMKALEFSRYVGAVEGKGQISLKESSEEMP